MLVSNAITAVNFQAKNDPKLRKKVILGAAISPKELRYWVRDNGCGVGDEIRTEMFLRGRSGFKRTGYGLYIAREFAHMGDGDIECVSTGTGTGSQFTIRVTRFSHVGKL